jgi:NADH-quinone oxidoreductase subunit J
VTSAIFLVTTIISLAGLFVLLNAFFLAAVQVLVYAGAVIVLFLFVIMLLDLETEERRQYSKVMVLLSVVITGALVGLIAKAITGARAGVILENPTLKGETIPLGQMLFTQYLLPFELVSVLLLVAMVGVILLSKKELK